MPPASQPPSSEPSGDRDAYFALVTADYDFGSIDQDLLGTVTVHVLALSVREQENGYSPDEDAVASLEEVGPEAGLEWALTRAAQVEIELEGLGSYYVGERPWNGAVAWPPSSPVRLRPFAPRAPWKHAGRGGPRVSWLLTVKVVTPARWDEDAGPAREPLQTWAQDHGCNVDTSTLDAFLAELAAAPVSPDGSRMLYTAHSPAVQLERELTDRTYLEALGEAQGVELPEGHSVGRVAVEPVGSGDRGWRLVVRHGDQVTLATPAVDLASGDEIPAGTRATVSGTTEGGGQRPRVHLRLPDGRSTTATQSQLLAG